MHTADTVLRTGAGLFLAAYGLHSFYLAIPNRLLLFAPAIEPVPPTNIPPAARPCIGRIAASRLPQVMAASLAVTWLNPHVYLDTVLLLGSLSANYPQPAIFGLGAILASFAFLYSVGYGARFLRPLFVHPSAWRILDGATGVLMFTVSVNLLSHIRFYP